MTEGWEPPRPLSTTDERIWMARPVSLDALVGASVDMRGHLEAEISDRMAGREFDIGWQALVPMPRGENRWYPPLGDPFPADERSPVMPWETTETYDLYRVVAIEKPKAP